MLSDFIVNTTVLILETVIILEKLQTRIKGSRLYIASYTERLYVPYSITYYCPVDIKVFFEVVNAKLELFVHVSSKYYSRDWCLRESMRVRCDLKAQFYEIIYDCELDYSNIPLYSRLKDNIQPEYGKIPLQERRALDFLCRRTVALLISESRNLRWLVAIKLAHSRYLAKQIYRLIIFLPSANIASFKKVFFEVWDYQTFPVLFVRIESLSHNYSVYENLLSYADASTMLIIDSCYLFKSPKSVRAQRMLEISTRCNYKLMMSDSLIVNNIQDVYMQYNILSELILSYYRWEDFSRMHILWGGIDGRQILGYKNVNYLLNSIKHYSYYMEGGLDDVWYERMEIYSCELTERQKCLYLAKKTELLLLGKSC